VNDPDRWQVFLIAMISSVLFTAAIVLAKKVEQPKCPTFYKSQSGAQFPEWKDTSRFVAALPAQNSEAPVVIVRQWVRVASKKKRMRHA
jgi:hypothetical protein